MPTIRRGRDSNPRYGYPYTRFPSVLLRPLGHLSTHATGEAVGRTTALPRCGGMLFDVRTVAMRCSISSAVWGVNESGCPANRVSRVSPPVQTCGSSFAWILCWTGQRVRLSKRDALPTPPDCRIAASRRQRQFAERIRAVHRFCRDENPLGLRQAPPNPRRSAGAPRNARGCKDRESSAGVGLRGTERSRAGNDAGQTGFPPTCRWKPPE